MQKKSLLFGLSCLAVLGVSAGSLASCGGTGGGFDYSTLDFSVDTRGVTINMWTGFGSSINEVLVDLLNRFTEETGINVTYESMGGYDQLQNAINLSASSGNLPNIAVGYPDHMVSYVNNNSILRLDPFFENDGDDTFTVNDFYADYMVENQSVLFDDNGNPYTLGVPFNKSTEVLGYNETFFNWAGALNENIYVPETWDQVRSVSQAINSFMVDYFNKVIGSDNVVYDRIDDVPSDVDVLLDFTGITEDMFHPFSYDSGANFFITTCRQWGGEYTVRDESSLSGYLAFDSDEVVEGLSFMKEAYAEDSIAIPQTFGEAAYASNPFKNMLSVMNVGSSAGVRNLVATGARFDVNVSHIPYHDADHKYVISQGTNLILFNADGNAEKVASWKLLKYLSKEVNGEFAARTGYFPSGEYAANSQEYRDLVENEPVSSIDRLNRDVTLLNTNVYMNDEEGWTKFVDAPFNGSSRIRNTVDSAMARVCIDQEDAQDVIDSLYSELSDYVRD